MGICASELREYVIRPTLKHLGDWSDAAENLLLGTAAQESGLGFHLRSRRRYSLGIYQITPQTHKKVWDKYLMLQPDLASSVRGLASQHEFLAHPDLELATNLSYATAVAWLVYKRREKTLPKSDDIEALANYWHLYFHARPTGQKHEFIQHYKQYITDANNIAA